LPQDATSLLMQRNGPALPPGGMGSAPLAGATSGGQPDPAGGGEDGGGMLPGILGKILSQQSQGDERKDFPIKQIDNMKRLAAVMVAHMDQSHPEVARHMSAAWRALDSALKAAETAVKNRGPALGPPLGFSGAQQADTGTAPVPAGAI
jgi:hypothetical protein